MRSRRGVLFALILGACALGVAVAVASAMRGEQAPASAAARDALLAAKRGNRAMVVFRNLEDTSGRGRVAVAPLADRAGRRIIEPLACDRVYFGAAGNGLCLARGDGFAAGYRAKVFGPDLQIGTSSRSKASRAAPGSPRTGATGR